MVESFGAQLRSWRLRERNTLLTAAGVAAAYRAAWASLASHRITSGAVRV